MRLEGCLAGPWVRELATCWRDASRSLDGRRLRVDLRDVCHVDGAGEALMAEMYREGASFMAAGCMMPEIVREISASADVARRS